MNYHFPLRWPEGWPRLDAGGRHAGKFKTTLHRACGHLLEELRRFGATDVLISANVPARRDGMPYSEGDPDDPAAAIWFKKDGEQRCIGSDRYELVAHNVQALASTIEAMRGIERWGTGQILKRTLDAFMALPAPRGTAKIQGHEPCWWLALSVHQDAPLAVCEAAYKSLMKQLGTTEHPDAYRLNAAISHARAAHSS